MIPQIQYARSGDVNIAYQVFGAGPIDLVVVPGWISCIETFWEEPGFARFLQRLGSFARVLLFDKRGTGLSDRVTESPTLEERMDDVRAVMDAVGSKRVRNWWAKMLRTGGSPSTVLALSTMNYDIDVRHVLGSIGVPTLLIHPSRDRAVPVELSRYMAERIRGARLIEIDSDDHLPFIADPTGIPDTAREFLIGGRGEIDEDRVVIAGVAVHIGARVAALAPPDTVLVSQTVKDLVAGSGLEFEDFGLHGLKGIGDRWHLYAVKGAPASGARR